MVSRKKSLIWAIYFLTVIMLLMVCSYIHIQLHLHGTLRHFRNKYKNCGVYFDA